MRYAVDHKARTRERLVAAAARALKAQGPAGVGVSGVMADAGLTHGGFYAHFPSREALIEEALAAGLEEMKGRFQGVVDGKPRDRALSDYIDFYVSARHRDRAAEGCLLTTLGADVARQGGAALETFARGHALLAKALAGLLDPAACDDPEALALSMTAEMVGAVTLARATPDRALSDRLLAASRAALKARAGLVEENTP